MPFGGLRWGLLAAILLVAGVIAVLGFAQASRRARQLADVNARLHEEME